MDAPPPARGWGRARDGESADGFDGRLDLDHLDAPLDLDVLSHDDEGPGFGERTQGWLERIGVLPWIRGHRAITTAAVVVLGIALVGLVIVRGTGTQGLPDVPLVSVTTGGNEPARVTVDPQTGQATEISQLVLVTSAEAPGVSVETLGVDGPGLSHPRSRVIPATAGSPTTGAVTSSLDCTARDETVRVATASSRDYRVLIRRTTADGETREDSVPLSGAEEWLNDVRHACVQIAADRDLQVAAVDAAPVEGNVAADVRLLVANSAPDPWRDVRVSTLGAPTVMPSEQGVEVPAEGTTWVPVRLWPDDCADPVAPLAAGVPLRSAVDDGGGAATESRSPTFRLGLDADSIDKVARALAAACAGEAPTVTVVNAGVTESSGDGSSVGTIDMVLRLDAPGASEVEIDDPLAGADGRVRPVDSPVAVVDGTAEVRVLWELPQCFDLLGSSGPKLRIHLVSDLSRPYALPLRGDELRLNLDRVCGSTVASTVR